MRSPAERFWGKVDKTDGCWLWTGARSSTGYGNFGVDGRTKRAHRFAYELLVGPIPDGLQLDHLCRSRACVNPAHLEPVTCRENLLRGVSPAATNAVKTHCKRGHEFTVENTRSHLLRGKYLVRECRECDRARQRAA